jgi:hypothetical protein
MRSQMDYKKNNIIDEKCKGKRRKNHAIMLVIEFHISLNWE